MRDHAPIRSRPEHVTIERPTKVGDGALSGITSFPARPCFGLDEQGAQLAYELARIGGEPIECLDPLQSLEESTRLLHRFDGNSGLRAAG